MCSRNVKIFLIKKIEQLVLKIELNIGLNLLIEVFHGIQKNTESPATALGFAISGGSKNMMQIENENE